jgi:hypothetical protein
MKLLDEVRHAIRVRHYSTNTERSYVRCCHAARRALQTRRRSMYRVRRPGHSLTAGHVVQFDPKIVQRVPRVLDELVQPVRRVEPNLLQALKDAKEVADGGADAFAERRGLLGSEGFSCPRQYFAGSGTQARGADSCGL